MHQHCPQGLATEKNIPRDQRSFSTKARSSFGLPVPLLATTNIYWRYRGRRKTPREVLSNPCSALLSFLRVSDSIVSRNLGVCGRGCVHVLVGWLRVKTRSQVGGRSYGSRFRSSHRASIRVRSIQGGRGGGGAYSGCCFGTALIHMALASLLFCVSSRGARLGLETVGLVGGPRGGRIPPSKYCRKTTQPCARGRVWLGFLHLSLLNRLPKDLFQHQVGRPSWGFDWTGGSMQPVREKICS